MTAPWRPAGLEGLSMAHHRELRSQSQYEHEMENTIPVERQREVTWGQPWVARVGRNEEGRNDRHWRWGRVLTYREAMLGHVDAGETVEELRTIHEGIIRRYDRGWRLSHVVCECSRVEHLASVHISSTWPVTWTEYGYAEAAGFRLRAYRRDEWYLAMVQRLYYEFERKEV